MALSGNKYQVSFQQELTEVRRSLTHKVTQTAETRAMWAGINAFYQNLMTCLKFKGMIHEIARRESNCALPGEEPMDVMDAAYLLGMFACDAQRALHPRTARY
jgi:hypothetical protein